MSVNFGVEIPIWEEAASTLFDLMKQFDVSPSVLGTMGCSFGPNDVNDFPRDWFNRNQKVDYSTGCNDKCSQSRDESTNPDTFDDLLDLIARNAKSESRSSKKVSITRVLYNPPATIVFWSDGTKTAVVDESFDKDFSHSVDDNGYLIYTDKRSGKLCKIYYQTWKEQGLTHAIVKKTVPNYFEILEKWC